MKPKRVFVSGGAGVIGSELVPRLVARLSEPGVEVLVGDLKPRPKGFAPQVGYRQGDLNAMTQAELAAFAPEVFIHLAATFERSTERYGFWEENFWHNLRLSHHLMGLAKDLPSLRRVVFASSYLIYDPALYQFDRPQQEAVRLKETAPILPRNLTGVAKLNHEIELRFLQTFRGQSFSSVCARIFRGYGRNSRDVISRWVRALLRQEPISLYRPEGIFDYIYAADTAEGLLRLALDTEASGIINLGTGQGRRVSELVEILRQHFPDMQLELGETDIAYEASAADIDLLQSVLGWRPEYRLEEAIAEIIAFERGRLHEPPQEALIPRVLVSSASRKVPLVRAMQQAVQRLHPEGQVIAADSSDGVLSAWVADAFWQMPATEDANLEAIIQGCRVRGINAILPTRDGELLFWARHSARLAAQGIRVMSSSETAIARCLDKLAWANFGQAQGLDCVATSTDIEQLNAETYVVKERFGAGARGVGIRLDKAAALAHARNLEAPIFQPWLAGEEISIDAWLDAGHRLKGLVLRRRELVVGGESQVTCSFRNAAIEAQATRALEALQLSGPVVLQGILSPEGRLIFIECNTRFGGASTLSIAAGLDSLYWSVLEAQGLDVGEYGFCRAAGELRQVRMPVDSYGDAE